MGKVPVLFTATVDEDPVARRRHGQEADILGRVGSSKGQGMRHMRRTATSARRHAAYPIEDKRLVLTVLIELFAQWGGGME